MSDADSPIAVDNDVDNAAPHPDDNVDDAAPHPDDRVVVRIDTNAAETPLADGVRAKLGADARVERSRLDVGDIEICARDASGGARRLVLERKSVADFAASICDGRYRDQTTRMLAPTAEGDVAPQYAYVVETASGIAWNASVGKLPGRCVHGAMLKLALRDGIPVLMSTGGAHTIELVVYLTRELTRNAFAPTARSYAPGVRKRKRDNIAEPRAMRVAMLTQIPGMSCARSEAILGKYPTFSELIAAPSRDIATIQCGTRVLGPVLAARVSAALNTRAV